MTETDNGLLLELLPENGLALPQVNDVVAIFPEGRGNAVAQKTALGHPDKLFDRRPQLLLSRFGGEGHEIFDFLEMGLKYERKAQPALR